MKQNKTFWSVLQTFFIQKNDSEIGLSRSVTFENTGRSGYAIFRDGVKTIRFYMEVGGSDCIFYMVIPSAGQWETQTGYQSEEREEILTYIADESQKKQVNVSGAYYNIEDTHIVFYQK
jgi:hypothetical protein